MSSAPRSRWKTAAAIALAVYWALLFAVTHYPRVRIPDELPQSDKVAHFSAFGLLALVWWVCFAVRRPLGPRFAPASAIALVAYAALDEYSQQFVGRYTDIADFIANTAGIVVVLAGLELRRRWRARTA